MNSNFKNVILVIVFNFSNCTNNKEFIKKLYSKYFKNIIFYSDTPNNGDEEINYLPINKGIYTPKIFSHLNEKYKDLINNSDGIFYTMDDNIINVNILNSTSNEKIIYKYDQPINTPLLDLHGWWWDGEFGKPKIMNLESDVEFKKYNINGYTGSFSDYFYIPKKYLTDTFFDLFKLFGKHEVFLEITVPTIINYIEPNIENYNKIDLIFLWGGDRHKLLFKDSFNYIFNQNFLLVHPVKFNENPQSKIWLTEIFNLEN
jgi:hypothetical protein